MTCGSGSPGRLGGCQRLLVKEGGEVMLGPVSAWPASGRTGIPFSRLSVGNQSHERMAYSLLSSGPELLSRGPVPGLGPCQYDCPEQLGACVAELAPSRQEDDSGGEVTFPAHRWLRRWESAVGRRAADPAMHLDIVQSGSCRSRDPQSPGRVSRAWQGPEPLLFF